MQIIYTCQFSFMNILVLDSSYSSSETLLNNKRYWLATLEATRLHIMVYWYQVKNYIVNNISNDKDMLETLMWDVVIQDHKKI